jgi:hypothetical protein
MFAPVRSCFIRDDDGHPRLPCQSAGRQAIKRCPVPGPFIPPKKCVSIRAIGVSPCSVPPPLKFQIRICPLGGFPVPPERRSPTGFVLPHDNAVHGREASSIHPRFLSAPICRCLYALPNPLEQTNAPGTIRPRCPAPSPPQKGEKVAGGRMRGRTNFSTSCRQVRLGLRVSSGFAPPPLNFKFQIRICPLGGFPVLPERWSMAAGPCSF